VASQIVVASQINEPGNARLKATKWDLEGFDGQQEVNKQMGFMEGVFLVVLEPF
jgi:hypothetical protein